MYQFFYGLVIDAYTFITQLQCDASVSIPALMRIVDREDPLPQSCMLVGAFVAREVIVEHTASHLLVLQQVVESVMQP